MKIRKITYENSPIFGNLEIDFTDSNGNSVDTIIIAGENGVGKSVLLNNIFGLCSIYNRHNQNIEIYQNIVFEIEFSKEELEIFNEKLQSKPLFNVTNNNIYNILIKVINSRILISFKNIDNSDAFDINVETSTGREQVMKVFKAIFSDAEINFNPKNIPTISSLNIDNPNLRTERSSENTPTQITQLLIDIQSLDALDLNEWVNSNKGKDIDESKIDVRMQRFISAFSSIFPTKRYKRVITKGNNKDIIFEENGREMSIKNLSSGEKQIVFRGGFLLKDKESTKEALILIDEPEISLHPNWQLKILSFLKKLFTNNNGEQTSQMFIATHSPFILHNSNRSNDKIIILQKDQNGKVIVAKDPKFYGWSPEQMIQEAFNISNLLSPNKTTVFLEGETDEKYYNKCLEVYDKLDIPFEFKWIGRINEKGQAEFSGDTSLNHVKSFFTANPEHIQHKVILFYDSDTSKPEENIGHLFIRQMRKNFQNTTFKAGVENLLVIDKNINIPSFYKESIKRDNYSAESIIRELNKTQLCNFICDNLNIEQQKYVLSKVNDEIERLIEDCK